MTTTRRFQRWRRIAGAAQALIVLGLPFVSVGGESALRLDVPAGRLHAFGASYAVDEMFVVLAATLALTAALLLVTLLFGRVWCGWSCPQTLLGDLTAWVEPERRKRPRRWRRPLGFAAVALVSAVASANLVWYFVPPAEFFRRLAAGALGPVVAGSWAAGFAVLFLDLAFLRQRFCATACPYAKLQGVLFDRSTLVVAYDARRAQDCVDCGACVRVCPTGIDIRHGLQMECIACAACIDACEPVMRKLRRAPDLIGYVYGEPGGRPRLARPAALVLAGVTAVTLAVLVATVAGRAPLGLTVLGDEAYAPRRTPDGRVLNTLSVGLENRGRRPVEVDLALEPGAGGEAELRPARVALAAGERRRVRVLAAVRGLPEGRSAARVVARPRPDGEAPGEAASAAVSLVAPEVK
ncbi:4Fe-4S ferredoxin iron-sulfur binding domain protein [Anaeromyxobacter sp. K]|uniref:4Fe-4S dicluster domain-containing protein n=1 Tax=Anaeromyxobacter sp. (strain K) TaxID=447217 RepID=UPI00017BE320|nr:4Fe-4S dicluster domain-containing protein [Anaeromyxobacter sp. K]ACG72467.1 4Fe-4S ferredoxin iron-sulfur binding domain protein [Anaeromyxobacter sp. K]